jgi:hypothetical protein
MKKGFLRKGKLSEMRTERVPSKYELSDFNVMRDSFVKGRNLKALGNFRIPGV